MDKEIETLVPVHFDGDAPAVKTLGGVLVIAHDHVTVRCLPKNLPHSITVSIAGLDAFHMSVSVKNLQTLAGVKVMDGPETVLLTVQEPRKEEVIEVAAPVPAEGEAAAPVAGAEGAPAAEGAAAGATAEAQSKEKVSKEKTAKEKGEKKK